MAISSEVDLGYVTQSEIEGYISRQCDYNPEGELAKAISPGYRSGAYIAKSLIKSMLRFSDRDDHGRIKQDEQGRFYRTSSALGKLVIARKFNILERSILAVNLDTMNQLIDPYSPANHNGNVIAPQNVGKKTISLINGLINERASDIQAGLQPVIPLESALD